ncbi:FAD-dependent monooxygenase [Alphaproteobacteria bacterium]|nr:FAD-dependent monooxygenase [Alphaproteobacteria bacterium]
MKDNLFNKNVIIAGAGPVGLTAALYLLLKNIPVTIIDSYISVPIDPRASTFHPPTLELLEKINVTHEMLNKGKIVNNWQYRDRKKGIIAEFNLEILSDITKYPFRLHFEQHKFAQMLLKKVESFKISTVIKGAQIINSKQNSNTVNVTYIKDGKKFELNGKYLIGADGGKSIIRKNLGVKFEGLTFKERFLVLTTTFDFKPYGFSGSCYVADPNEWCAIFNVPAEGPPGHWRIVFPDSTQRTKEELFNDDLCQKRMQAFLPNPENNDYEIIHKNLYQVHQRIAQKFRKENIFLAGDAAHVNNPLGGMGLNFGIHDALNIGEKISSVLKNESDESVFDLYDRQRRTVAEEYLLSQTAQNKRDLEEKESNKRIERQNEWKNISKDPLKSKQFLMKTAMFESTKRAMEII